MRDVSCFMHVCYTISDFVSCMFLSEAPLVGVFYLDRLIIPWLDSFKILLWQKRPGSPRQRNEQLNAKPPLPSNAASFRKGTYHESLDFVQSLCDTSYGLVDIFPIEDRKSALCEVAYSLSCFGQLALYPFMCVCFLEYFSNPFSEFMILCF